MPSTSDEGLISTGVTGPAVTGSGAISVRESDAPATGTRESGARPTDTGKAGAGLTRLKVLQTGEMDYQAAWEMQGRIHRERVEGSAGDTLLLTSHPHVYTLGKSTDRNHLLADAAELESGGAAVVETDRGGDVTYHGPGQIVAYPIIDLREHGNDAHAYLRKLEEVVIRSVAPFGIIAGRDLDYTGVWAAGKKLAAIGVRISHGVTMHGFALNVTTDLARFDRIIPCGIGHKGVTSMKELLGYPVSIQAVREAIVGHFCGVFSCEPQ
jgi:lipoate-protein ligase B